jgi:hypothetical protein
MDLTRACWRKSSHSSGNGGACVEVAVVAGDMEAIGQVIAVRDSKDPHGPALIFTPDEWVAFTAGTRGGQFDLA